jgi:hypothetical protein
VAPVLGRVRRHHDLVTEPGRDLVVAAGAAVRLDRLVRVHVAHLDGAVGSARGAHAAQPNTAQSTSAAVTTSATTTITMSLLRFAWERNGLRPTPLR